MAFDRCAAVCWAECRRSNTVERLGCKGACGEIILAVAVGGVGPLALPLPLLLMACAEGGCSGEA